VVMSLISVSQASGERIVHGTAKSGVVDRGGSDPVWVLDNVLAMKYVFSGARCVRMTMDVDWWLL
jgi:hypothetical protein